MPTDPPAFEIRSVTREEAPAWRELRAEALKNHPAAFMSAYEDFILLDEETVAARIPPPGGADVLFGVYAAGVLSGCAGFLREVGLKERHKGYMWGVYLRPMLRGTGAGEALVAAVIDQASRHVEILRSAVSTENLGARALYLRMGFHTYGIEPRALRTGGRDYDDELLALVFESRA